MTDKPEPAKNLISRVDTETALFGLLFIAALLMRLIDLDARPLGLAEAERALAAWRLAEGQGASAGSPLLLHGTAVLFFLFRANDFTARLFPALLGAFAVLLPYFWRQRLGHLGALLAAGLLALSPLTLFASRSLEPGIFVAVFALSALTATMRYADSGDARWLYAGAVSAALLLASGPGAYFSLLVFAAAGVALWLLRRRGRSDLPDSLGKQLTGHAASLRAAGLVFLGTAVGVGTLLFLNLKGMRGFADVLSEWWHGFGSAGNLPWFSPVLWPLLYEPLILIFGIVGGIRAVRDKDLWGSLLFGWALGSAVMLMAWPARTSDDFALLSLPFALLAGKQVAALLEDARTDWRGLRDGVFVGVFVILAVYVYLQLSGFADRGHQAFAILAWVGLALAAALTIGHAILYGHGNALRNLGLAGASVALLVTLAAAFGSAYNAGGRNVEYLEPLPTSPGVRTLAADAATWSLRRTGDAQQLPVVILLPEPSAAEWYLRGFRSLEVREGGSASADVVIALEGAQSALAGSYSGQPYEYQQDRRWRQLSARDWWKWALWRTVPAPAYNRAVLWLKVSSAAGQ